MKLRGGHRLKFIYFSVLLALIPALTILVLFTGDISIDRSISGPSKEAILTQQLIELREKLNHVEMLNQQRKIEVNYLRETIRSVSNNDSRSYETLNHRDQNNYGSPTGLDIPYQSHSVSSDQIELPTLVHFLPHLLKNPDPLTPAFRRASARYPNGRTGVNLVLGIPTVKRPVQSYLVQTLRNIIDNINPSEREEALIVVFIAETDMVHVKKQVAELEGEFSEFIDSGLLEIISPSAAYYPDFNSSLKQTLGDPMDRVKWRTKQNLDFAYLMMYCQSRGVYYVQLEDDIITEPGFLTKMKTTALKHTAERKDWFIIDFCSLGFIGKMVKAVDLPFLIIFFIMFHNDKPVDWLLFSIGNVRYCRTDGTEKQCRQAISRHWIQHWPSLFQHIGTHSSLKGKVQKLKEKSFGKVSGFQAHTDNPSATVTSTIQQYKTFSASGVYEGYTYFWGISPKAGDYILIEFTDPIVIDKFFIRTSNYEHPEDKFYNTTVEVLPLFKLLPPPPDIVPSNQLSSSSSLLMSLPSSPSNSHPSFDQASGSFSQADKVQLTNQYNRTSDGFVVVADFKSTGIAEGSCAHLGAVKMLRIHCHVDSSKWVLINEIYIKPKLK